MCCSPLRRPSSELAAAGLAAHRVGGAFADRYTLCATATPRTGGLTVVLFARKIKTLAARPRHGTRTSATT